MKPVWEDDQSNQFILDFTKNCIHIYKSVSRAGKFGSPKSKRGFRAVPLDEGVMRLLARHKVAQDKEKLAFGAGYNPDSLVFTTARGRRILRESALYQFVRSTDRAGVPYITIHGMRHTHATMLLRNGMSVNTVAERLGDAPETIYETYGHVTPRMQSDSVRITAQAYHI